MTFALFILLVSRSDTSFGFAVVVVALGSGSLMMWRIETQYAAEVQTVTSPDGQRYDILVHRDGVMLYTKGEGMFNAYSIFPTVIALIRRWRRGPWRWAVTVRQSRFHGYPDLLREVVDDDRTARRRAQEIANLDPRSNNRFEV